MKLGTAQAAVLDTNTQILELTYTVNGSIEVVRIGANILLALAEKCTAGALETNPTDPLTSIRSFLDAAGLNR